MAKNVTKNVQKRVEAEQSSYYREYPVAFGQKREIVGVGQSDMANNTLCRNCFQGTSVFGQKAPGAPVFGHCPKKYSEKATSPNKQKKETRVAIGTPAYRRAIERRAATSTKA